MPRPDFSNNYNRSLGKRGFREEFEGDTEHRTAAYSNVREDSSTGSTYKLPLEVEFPKRSNQIHEIVRVNHAGEYGAKRIYQGQLKYIKSEHKLIKDMLEQELVHLNYFEKQLLERKVRPTALLFLWHHLGFLLGCISAKIGTKTAMLVTESVEEVIEKHYQEQIDYLSNRNIEPALLDNITKFRLDEIEHKDIAILNDSEQAIFAGLTSKIVKTICRVAIRLSKKI